MIANKVRSQLRLMKLSRGLHEVQSREDYTGLLTLLALQPTAGKGLSPGRPSVEANIGPAVYLCSPQVSEESLPGAAEVAPTVLPGQGTWRLEPSALEACSLRRCRDLDELEETAKFLYHETLRGLRESDGKSSLNDFKYAEGTLNIIERFTKGPLTQWVIFGHP